jgi:iron complex outermembrane recepter protein
MTSQATSSVTAPARRQSLTLLFTGTALALTSAPAVAQVTQGSPGNEATAEEEAIVVTGFRSSLASALNEKRNATSLVEVIQAEDIGKLPDQNLAEVLENITGVQITREAGVGTGVQIRGTNDNRTEINGVSTVGSGTGRGGISFEDINPAIIASVEVIKAPTAKTIEGSVGGTVNLRTLRPLDLRETLLSFRAQGEYSELSKSVTPRLSGSAGKKFDLGSGELGIVLSGSWSQQEATSFRPRVDRDVLVPTTPTVLTATGGAGPNFPFLGIQFLNQELENFEYETVNLAGSLEYAPSDKLTFYFDTIFNDQERRQDSSRVQASGVTGDGNILLRNNVPSSFETVKFGSLGGRDLGTIQAALKGTIVPNAALDGDDPNLRFSSDVGARLTTSELYRLGVRFEIGRLSAAIEGARSISNTRSPDLSTTLNFVNPGVPLVGTANDNRVPFAYDLTGGALAFGIDSTSSIAPTSAQLLNPANVRLQQVVVGDNRARNKEDAFRADFSYDLKGVLPGLVSVDFGYRFNKTSNAFTQIRSTFTTSNINSSPSGNALAGLIVPGPNNFGDADGRSLFFRDFVLIDPNRAFTDRAGTLAALQAAIEATPLGVSTAAPLLPGPAVVPIGSFSVDETVHAAYGQVNLEVGPVRAVAGVRYVRSKVTSFGTGQTGATTFVPLSAVGRYNNWLPRFNLTADLSDRLVARASYTKDINRPNFNALSLSTNFPTGPNNAVNVGNPNLVPETVDSFDLSLDYYFAPSSVISVALFHKVRSNLFVTRVEPAAIDANGYRDITPPCEGGGIFNPLPDRNVLSNLPGNGLCVPINTTLNDTGRTKQSGVEVALQYDLSQFESTLGFASGFGVQANFTYQKFSGGNFTNSSVADTRAGAIFAASSPGITLPVTEVQGLLDFSEKSYNLTAYYEKHGLSARLRYAWRSAFRTLDTAGGATVGSTLGFPVVTAARGQLNGSITYDVTDRINVGIEAVNLTKSKVEQYCVNDGALLCFQGLPDRRITFGASIKL